MNAWQSVCLRLLWIWRVSWIMWMQVIWKWFAVWKSFTVQMRGVIGISVQFNCNKKHELDGFLIANYSAVTSCLISPWIVHTFIMLLSYCNCNRSKEKYIFRLFSYFFVPFGILMQSINFWNIAQRQDLLRLLCKMSMQVMWSFPLYNFKPSYAYSPKL